MLVSGEEDLLRFTAYPPISKHHLAQKRHQSSYSQIPSCSGIESPFHVKFDSLGLPMSDLISTCLYRDTMR